MRFFIICSTLLTLALVQGREVCYNHEDGTEKYGCFTTDSPWTHLLYRPIGQLPNKPEEVATRYLLFTPEQNSEHELMEDKPNLLEYSTFSPTRRTYMLIHGFTHNKGTAWVKKATQDLISQEDCNVIVIDWGNWGVFGTLLAATANARLNAARIAYFLKFVTALNGFDSGNLLHIIGHGLGVHVAGYVGNRVPVDIITGLDPTDSYFTGCHQDVRISPDDARRVYIVHSNRDTLFSMGLGMPDSVGHVDYWPNGGKTMPGCRDSIIDWIGDIISDPIGGIIDDLSCSHVRGIEYWIETITGSSSCPSIAYRCKDQDEFDSGKCENACGGSGGQCTVLGLGAEKFPEASGNYYFNTHSDPNYCLQQVLFSGLVNEGQEETRGKIFISFKQPNGQMSKKMEIVDHDISPSSIQNKWLRIQSNFIKSPTEKPLIMMRYERSGLLPTFQAKSLELDEITLQILDEDLKLHAVNYPRVVLQYGQDYILEPQE